MASCLSSPYARVCNYPTAVFRLKDGWDNFREAVIQAPGPEELLIEGIFGGGVVRNLGKGVAPIIKIGSAGGKTAGKAFPQAIKDAAKAENPLSTCVFCGREGVATQVDHAIPKVRGGNATLDNAQMACPHCNASKGARNFPVNPPPGYTGKWPP